MKSVSTGQEFPTGWSRRAVLGAIVWLAGSAPPLLLTACDGISGGPPPAPTGSAAAGATIATAPTEGLAGMATPSQPAAAATPSSGPGPTATAATAGASPTVAVVVAVSPTTATQTESSAATAQSSSVASGTCVLSPEMTEGPYYIDENLNRSDITEGKPGVPLQLRLTVQNASTCRPLANATIDIWHCDAAGVYSGYSAAQAPGGPGGPGAPPSGNPPQGGPPPGGGPGAAGGGGHAQPTNKETFLRGNQQTDASGLATFATIYPGWYTGRATHIHVKVHAGGNVVHTGQLFFDDALTDQVYAQAPYASHGKRETTNATDGIYASGGAQSMPTMTKTGSGYVATIALGVKV